MTTEHGLVHLYYGDGKGKTTAALGLALRCAGWGERVVVAQFLKHAAGGEVSALSRLPEITLLRDYPVEKFTFRLDESERLAAASACLSLFRRAAALSREERARLLVLDEVLDALRGFLPLGELTAFLDARPPELEVVLTGHDLPPALAARADYITRMAKEKHPYDRGVSARKGIEL